MSIQALILCGGKGERLRPFTDNLPKPLVEINHKAILGYVIDHLSISDIEQTIVATGYRSEKIERYIEEKYSNENIIISDLGDVDIVERIKGVAADVKDDLLVMYGDTISDVNLKELFDFSQNQEELVTVTLWPLRSQFGVLETDENNKVTSYVEKPVLNKWINIGYFYFKQKGLSLLEGCNSFEGFLTKLVAHQELAGYKHKGEHITVNTLKELKEAESRVLKI